MMSQDNDMIMFVSGKKHLISGVVKLYGRSDTHGSFYHILSIFVIEYRYLLPGTGRREAKTRASDSRLISHRGLLRS